jgi:Ras-related protein Rab-4A/Ras-related protein Rab-4B
MPRANEAEGTAFVESLFRKAASILLVFDLTNRSSFENLGKWVEDIRSKCNNEIAIIVVGNKQDK